jgi:hypothetical protein
MAIDSNLLSSLAEISVPEMVRVLTARLTCRVPAITIAYTSWWTMHFYKDADFIESIHINSTGT